MDAHPFETPGSHQLAAWTLRLAVDPMFRTILLVDPHLFALFYASCASAVEPPDSLVPADGVDSGFVGDKLLGTLKDLQRQFGESTSGQFARLYLSGIAIYDELGKDPSKVEKCFKEWLELAEQETSMTINSQEVNIDRLAKLLGLEEEEKRLLIFQLNRGAPAFKPLYDILLGRGETLQVTLGSMLEISYGKMMGLLSEDSTLVKSGLIAVQERPLMISSPSAHLRATLAEPANSDEEFIKRFVKPLEPSPSTASLARLDDRDRDVLVRLMRMDTPEEHGFHTLVYGPRSVDKLDCLARLFKDEKIDAYAVQSKNVPPEDLPAWVHIAQRQLEDEDPDSVLVIDRAEQALASRAISMLSFFGMEDSVEDEDRASDQGLTSSPVRCVWLTDRGGRLSERNLGRFLFHCEVLPGSRADRRERIASVITEFELSKDLEHHLAKYSLLGEQQVRQAARLARLVAGEDVPIEEREQVIKRAVHQSQKVLSRDRTEELRDSVTTYDLNLLNVTGRFAPQQILNALKKNTKGSLCFYGLPGSGKTQLAEYFAVELDLPIMMKRASDIYSKWLGESEQNIAEMFKEAEAEGALLFLDEADTFLRDRAMARAEWSVSTVNEMLQRLETFATSGIFIAATNLFQDIDAAALRRFTFKLEFLPLKPEQAWQMLCNESGFDESGASEDEVEDLKARLGAIKDLAPGDYATVRRQALLFMEDEPLTTDMWIEQLALEAKAKMHGLAKQKLGFGADK